MGSYNFFPVYDTTAGGNYLMAGGVASSLGSRYAYAVTDQNGNPLWVKDSALYSSIGMHDAGFLTGLRAHDDGFVFAGELNDFSLTSRASIFILKTDTAGNEIWRKRILPFQGGAASAAYQAMDSALYFAGYVQDNVTNDISQFLLKLSANGDSLFMKTFPYAGYVQGLLSIDNKLFICSRLSGGYSLISTDTLGNFLAYHSFIDSLNNYYFQSFSKTIDENILITGSVRDSAQQGAIQLLKVDTAANIIWSDTLSNFPYFRSSACVLPNGNILVAYGNFQVEERNPNGDTLWVRDFGDTIPGAFFLEVNNIFPLDNETFLISGDVGYSSPGANSPYLMKISRSQPSNIVEQTSDDYVMLYPNPAETELVISINGEIKSGMVNIFNTLGETVLSKKFSSRTIVIDIDQPAGVYIVQVNIDSKYFTRKLIVN